MNQHRHPHPPTQADTATATTTQTQPAIPTIAVRKSCNPDGIGLSHYVLMDKKAPK